MSLHPPRAPAPARDDQGAAMVTALMLVMVVGTLSILVLGTLMSQVRPASLTQKTTRTIFAAEAGTQVALGELRTTPPKTVNGAAYGDPAKLPCTLSGAVGGSASTLTYSVTVQYFTADPSALTRDERAASPTLLPCSDGSGVSTAPAFAVISSRGLAAGVPGLATTVGDRTLETQYAFRRTNVNIPGGLFRTSDRLWCLTASSATAGSLVTYTNACDVRTTRNLWVHAEQSYVMLASTATSGSPLCLSGPRSSDDRVELAPCAVTARQLFSYKSGFRYEGQNDANTGVGGRCLWAGATTSALQGQELRVSSGGCGIDNVQPYWSWNPEPAVGAGSASRSDSQQLINYAEFGRCLEVTREQLDELRMGIGPCKQNIPGNGNRWNQVWTRTETLSGSTVTTLEVTKPSSEPNPPTGTRCLTTPQSSSTSVYPTLVTCSSTSDDQKWTRTMQMSDYATSYLFIDRYGRCLSAGETYSPDGSALTGVEVLACDGSGKQKWNAPPNTTPPGQSNTHEG